MYMDLMNINLYVDDEYSGLTYEENRLLLKSTYDKIKSFIPEWIYFTHPFDNSNESKWYYENEINYIEKEWDVYYQNGYMPGEIEVICINNMDDIALYKRKNGSLLYGFLIDICNLCNIDYIQEKQNIQKYLEG